MDIKSTQDISVSEDVNKAHDLNQLPLDPLGCSVAGAALEDNLGDGLTEFLRNENVEVSASSSTSVPPFDKNDVSNVGKEDTTEPCKTEMSIVTSDECLSKCATIPSSYEVSSSASVDTKEEEDDDQLNKIPTDVLKENVDGSKKTADNTLPLPTPLKLVSAMKGSREKHGTPPTKLTVKWAPDVYDPPPTAASHVPTNKKQQRHRSDGKKSGKNKQKGKRGKDKKQVRKSGGSSDKCFKPLDNVDRVIQYRDPYADLGGFGVGTADPHCGSSFLRKSVAKMHFPVAEAT